MRDLRISCGGISLGIVLATFVTPVAGVLTFASLFYGCAAVYRRICRS